MWFFKNKTPKIEKRTENPTISIRMEAIGGQGANSAGKILAEAAVLGMHYTGNHFSSFGSEKRGSPVRSFVRFSPQKKTIRTASAIKNPDTLIIFHELLLGTHADVLDGSTETTDLILNTEKKPKEVQFTSEHQFRTITTIDATHLALKHGCGLNTVMLGAASILIPEIEPEILKKHLGLFFHRLSPEAQQKNMAGFEAGRNEAKTIEFVGSEKNQSNNSATHPIEMPVLGYLNAPIGGLIANPGNTVLKDHSASRKGVMPRFNKDVCFNCGFCDMVCPDFCFVWKKDPEGKKPPELQGIDYQYCKACQKCIVACPVQALTPTLEAQIPENEKLNKLFPEINAHNIEDQWKNADWKMYSEKLSPEERMLTIQTELLDPNSYIRPDFSTLIEVPDKKAKDET